MGAFGNGDGLRQVHGSYSVVCGLSRVWAAPNPNGSVPSGQPASKRDSVRDLQVPTQLPCLTSGKVPWVGDAALLDVNWCAVLYASAALGCLMSAFSSTLHSI